jgi:general secretion pathway protein L
MRLVVSIPERWEDSSVPVSWALARPDGTLAREGESTIADLPSAKQTTLVVAASRVLLTAARLPRRGARRVRHALAYAIEDQLTSDPESVHAVAAGAPRDNHQSIAVIEREWLQALLASFESAGVSPDSVTVETCRAPIVDGSWTLVLHKEGGFLRTGEAAGMGLDSSFDGTVPRVVQLALEAARVTGTAPQKIVIHTDSAFDLRPGSASSDCSACWRGRGAVGNSLGDQAWSSCKATSLANRGGLSAYWPRLRPAAILASAALAIEVVGTLCHWGALRYERAQLEARMRDQFKAAFPQAQAIVDPALQMRRNLQAARAAAGVPQEGDFLPLLARAVHASPRAGWKVKAITYDAGRLTLDVILADREQADSILKRVADKDVAVTLEAASPKGTGGEARFVFAARSSR